MEIEFLVLLTFQVQNKTQLSCKCLVSLWAASVRDPTVLEKKILLNVQHVQKDINERDILERFNMAAFAEFGCGKIWANFE